MEVTECCGFCGEELNLEKRRQPGLSGGRPWYKCSNCNFEFAPVCSYCMYEETTSSHCKFCDYPHPRVDIKSFEPEFKL